MKSLALWCLLAVSALADETPKESLYQEWNAWTVERVTVTGLTRTHEESVLWVLGVKAGQTFDSVAFHEGSVRLYSTESVWELHPKFTPIDSTRKTFALELYVHEKWTLIPQFRVLSGGGQSIFGAGIQDTNLFGRYTEGDLLFATQNGSFFYDVYIEQEYIRDTPWHLITHVSRDTNSVTWHDSANTVVDRFETVRDLGEVGLGYRLPHEWEVRLDTQLFRESITLAPSTSLPVLPTSTRVAFRPWAIWGRVVFVEDREMGERLRLGGSVFPATSLTPTYGGLSIDWKQSLPIADRFTFAYRGVAAFQFQAPTNAQTSLGGYDSVRGFSADRAVGSESVRANLELRTRLGYVGLPVAERVSVQADVFLDSGLVRSHLGQSGLALVSVGAGLRFHFVKFSRGLFRIDYAQTLTPSEGGGINFSLGSFF